MQKREKIISSGAPILTFLRPMGPGASAKAILPLQKGPKVAFGGAQKL